MIYTSYYGNIRNIEITDKTVLVAISRFIPKGITNCVKMEALAPPVELLTAYKKGAVNEMDYRRLYNLHITKNYDNLMRIVNKLKVTKKDVYFLCYERSGEFCHRNILKDKLNEFGLNVNEF